MKATPITEVDDNSDNKEQSEWEMDMEPICEASWKNEK